MMGWGSKGSFESRAKQMAKQMLAGTGSLQSKVKSDANSDESNAERTPFKNRVEMMFAAISKPTASTNLIPTPLSDLCDDPDTSSTSKRTACAWVVADFPEDISAVKRAVEKEAERGSNVSDGESADDALVDDEGEDPRKEGLSQSIEVLPSNPYEQQCLLSSGPRIKKGERRVRFSSSDAPCTSANDATESRDAPKADRPARHPKLCFSFSQTGQCRFGEGCAFRHVVSGFVANPDKYTKYDISWDEEEEPGAPCPARGRARAAAAHSEKDRQTDRQTDRHTDR